MGNLDHNEVNETIDEQMNGGNGSDATTAVFEEATAGDGAQREPTLEELLAEAQSEAARNLEGWQRTQAEFANARKRLEKQRAEAYVNANADAVTRLLPIADDFERALQSAPADVQSNSWFSGMELVYRKLITVLEGMGATAIEAVGQPFDPNMHEALGQEASDQFESGVVTREMQKGYRLGDRVIRPALVYVAE